MDFREKLRRIFRKIVRIIKPPAMRNIYVYELVISGVIYPFTDRTRLEKNLRYSDATCLQWEVVFDEFCTLLRDPREVEVRYRPDIVSDLLPRLEGEMIARNLTTYSDEVKAELLLKLPLAPYFKEWIREQIEKGKYMIKVHGVGRLSLRDISAKLKEIVSVEERKLVFGRITDEYEFRIIRPDEIKPYATIFGEWEHDII